MHKIFVYGTLKRGFPNHHWLGKNECIGETVTVDSIYDMISMSNSTPGVIHGEYRIGGEIYLVDDSGLEALDCLESNGLLYTRILINVIGHENVWMYMLNQMSRNYSHNNVENKNGVLWWNNNISIEEYEQELMCSYVIRQ